MEDDEVCVQCGMVHEEGEGWRSLFSIVFLIFFLAFVFLIFQEASLN